MKGELPIELLNEWKKDRDAYLERWDACYGLYLLGGDPPIPKPDGYGDIASERELRALWRSKLLIYPPLEGP